MGFKARQVTCISCGRRKKNVLRQAWLAMIRITAAARVGKRNWYDPTCQAPVDMYPALARVRIGCTHRNSREVHVTVVPNRCKTKDG